MQPLQLSPRYSEALPMYYRLQQTLIDKIICQDWKAGMQLPSEREIAATMGISVGTVRKALENMVHKGSFEAGRKRNMTCSLNLMQYNCS